MKRFLTPLFIVAAVLLVNLVLRANLPSGSLENQPYFIKTLPSKDIVVVEPNYGWLYGHSPEALDQEYTSGRALFDSLNEIEQNHLINNVMLTTTERKGQIIPNLYVFVQ
ncbi:MAG: hypothetical protein ACFB4I_23010 [Cyanophyceae cyanobacterium]